MVGIQEAAVRAAGLVHEGISTGAWAELMAQFDRALAGRDAVVRRAASLAPLLSFTNEEWQPPFNVTPPTGGAERVSAGDHRLARLATLQATRAAKRSATESERLLLAGVERELLEPATQRGPVESALRGWGLAVSREAASMSPESASRVSRTQQALLRRGAALLRSHELVDGVGQERLVASVAASSAAWDEAYTTWRTMVPKRATALDDLGRATVALQLVFRDATDQDILDALMRTGFGANLVGALAVTPHEFHGASDLVRTALDLEPKTDVATTFHATAPTPPANGIEVTDRSDSVVVSEPLSPPSVPRVSPESRSSVVLGVDVAGLKDHEALEELARLRDAGVVAAAARAGVPEARRATGDASDEELIRLVEVGTAAKTALAEAAMPTVGFWAGKVHSVYRDDFRQNAMVRVLEAAAKWDPQKSAWGTYAYAMARFQYVDGIRLWAKRREDATDTVGEHSVPDHLPERVFGSVATSPEEAAVAATERDRAQRLLGLVEPMLREAVAARLGERGRDEQSLDAVAEQLGVHRSTAWRRVGKAVERLQRLAQDENGAGTAGLRQLAIALRVDSPAAPRTPGPERRTPSTGVAAVTPSCV